MSKPQDLSNEDLIDEFEWSACFLEVPAFGPARDRQVLRFETLRDELFRRLELREAKG